MAERSTDCAHRIVSQAYQDSMRRIEMSVAASRVAPDAPVAPDIAARVESLLRLPYHMTVRGTPDEGYLAEVAELSNCFTAGETPEEALALLRDAMRGWLTVRLEQNLPIPEPGTTSDEAFSGR